MIRKQRKLLPSLTPMIDVVFLLLLFFMLSTQLKKQEITDISIEESGGGASAANDIVLVEIGERPSLNGKFMDYSSLLDELARMDAQGNIAIRPDDSVSTQDLLQFKSVLDAQNWKDITFVEGQS